MSLLLHFIINHTCDLRLTPLVSLAPTAPWPYPDTNGSPLLLFNTLPYTLRLNLQPFLTHPFISPRVRCPMTIHRLERKPASAVLRDAAQHPGLPYALRQDEQRPGQDALSVGRDRYRAQDRDGRDTKYAFVRIIGWALCAFLTFLLFSFCECSAQESCGAPTPKGGMWRGEVPPAGSCGYCRQRLHHRTIYNRSSPIPLPCLLSFRALILGLQLQPPILFDFLFSRTHTYTHKRTLTNAHTNTRHRTQQQHTQSISRSALTASRVV